MSKDHQEYDLTANIQEVLSLIHTPAGGNGDNYDEPDEEERETIHVYPVEGGGILFTRTPILEDDDLETSPLPARPATQPASDTGSGIMVFGVFITLLCVMCIMVQWNFMLNPFTVTATLVAKSQQLTLQGTSQLGRVLNPITVSQSQTIPTTGHGHQDARAATGYLTFLNGQFNQVDVPAGTIFTSSSGVQVITDQDAVIPAASPNPPSLGQVTVAAHAINSGSAGNIPALDVNAQVSSTLFVKNLNAFTGGQDERNFQTVAKSDIANAASPLKATVAQSINGALQGQLKQGERLQTLPCTPTITADHQAGQEATTVKVTASETCSGIAYDSQELTNKVTQLLTTQATKKLGTGYSMLNTPQIHVTQATTHGNIVVVPFTAQSSWVYALSSAEQQSIKKLIAGKSTEKAIELLLNLPGIESVSLTSSGFGDDTRVPKDPKSIHLVLIYGL